jgi:hypothetical protein
MTYKFRNSDHKYPKNINFGKHTIFQYYHLSNTPIYWKVTEAYDNKLFDFHECDRQGNLIRCGIFRLGMTRQWVLDWIEINHFRIYALYCIEPYYTTSPTAPCLSNACPTS